MATEGSSAEDIQLAEIQAIVRNHPRKNEIEAWADVLRTVLAAGEPARIALALVGAEEAAKP